MTKQESFQGGSECQWCAEGFVRLLSGSKTHFYHEIPGGTRLCTNAAPAPPASVESFQGMLERWRELQGCDWAGEPDAWKVSYNVCADELQLLFTRLVELRDSWREEIIECERDTPSASMCISCRQQSEDAAQLTELIEGKVQS